MKTNKNEVNNAAAALILANGEKYETAAADVNAAETAAAAAVQEMNAKKEEFAAVSAQYTETRNAVTAAELDAAKARYNNGTATNEDALLLANSICNEHAAAAVSDVMNKLAEMLSDKDTKKALHAAVADSVSLGAACRAVRDRYEQYWGKFFQSVGVAVHSTEISPAAFRPHACNPFAVAVTKDGQRAALPMKNGVLRAVTQWNAEKVAIWIVWNDLCTQSYTAAQCEERRALMEQVTAQYVTIETARRERREEMRKARAAERAAAENKDVPALVERNETAAAVHREKAKDAARRTRRAKKDAPAVAADVKALNAAAAAVADVLTTETTTARRRTRRAAAA